MSEHAEFMTKYKEYMTRHTAREVALAMLFQLDVGKNNPAMADRTLEESGLNPELAAFASGLAFKTFEIKDELDARIEKYLAHDWSTARLAYVDKEILRMALTEFYYYDEIPIPVSIDEAIELAKTFAGAEAPAFINGVLDKLVKTEKLDMKNREDGAAK